MAKGNCNCASGELSFASPRVAALSQSAAAASAAMALAGLGPYARRSGHAHAPAMMFSTSMPAEKAPASPDRASHNRA